MQALCCLSGALVLGPGGQVPREFTGRPDSRTDKGTGAQHRQVLSPDTSDWVPSGVFLTRPSTEQVTLRQQPARPL